MTEVGYAGPVTVRAGTASVSVSARLTGYFEPIDGRFHWYGRLPATPALDDLGPGAEVEVATPHGTSRGRLSDPDPWGRLRVAGLGRPPY